MANIFTWEAQDVDLKECIKIKTNCQQDDTMVLQFNIYDYDSPVNLTNFNVTFVAKKPDGTVYGQAESITKSNNFLTITCDSQLTSVTGRVVGTIVITDNSGNRKGSYFIVLNVFGIVTDEDRVVSQNFVDILNRFDEDVAIALLLSDKFTKDIETAQAISNDFAIKIPQANAIDTILNNTINSANTINSTLTNTNTTANTLENKLSSDITIGTTLKTNLESSLSTAGQTNDALITTIENAGQIKQDLQNFDPNSIVYNTNTMLDEMYCTQELLSLNHNLNGYPIVKMTYTEYGAGIGGAGDFPAGANSQCNLMQNKSVYIDRNNLKIYVPQDYYIANPLINKINDYKYIITFTNSTRSILIELIEGDVQNQVKQNASSISTIDDKINDLTYQTAGGTATAITLSLPTLINGYSKTFIASTNNSGVATTINGKPLYKPNTTASPNIISGKAYTVWYNSTGDCFFIKASAEGNTIASHVLAGDTFSNDDDTGIAGTLDLSNLVSGNIKSGVTINGISGSNTVVDTADAVLDPQYLVSGYSGYDDGIKKNGTMANHLHGTSPLSYYADGNGNLIPRIPIGAYLDEWGGNGVTELKCYDENYIASNILNGKSIFGLTGTATVQSMGGKRVVTGTFYNTWCTTQYIDVGFYPSLVIVGDGNTIDIKSTLNADCVSQGCFVNSDQNTSHNYYYQTNIVFTGTGFNFGFTTESNQLSGRMGTYGYIAVE